HRLIMHRRAQMKMTRHERRLNVRTAKFASHEMCARAFPDRMLDVYDRRHQCNEAKILLDHREKRPDPATVAGPEDAELAATSVAQRRYQLPHLDHTLTQPFRVANEISRDRQFAVPVATRRPRIMIRQMDETRIPSETVKVGSPATISDVSCRHERVQHQHRWCAPAALTSEKICASDVVCRKFGNDRTRPGDHLAVADLGRRSATARNSVKIVCREFLAFRHIALHFIAAARMQAVP